MEPLWDGSSIEAVPEFDGLPMLKFAQEAERVEQLEFPRPVAIYRALLGLKRSDDLLVLNSAGHAAALLRARLGRAGSVSTITGDHDEDAARSAKSPVYVGDVGDWWACARGRGERPDKVLAFPQPLSLGGDARRVRAGRLERAQGWVDDWADGAGGGSMMSISDFLPALQAAVLLGRFEDGAGQALAVLPASALRRGYSKPIVADLLRQGYIERITFPRFSGALEGVVLATLSGGNKYVRVTDLGPAAVPSFAEGDLGGIEDEARSALSLRSLYTSRVPSDELLALLQGSATFDEAFNGLGRRAAEPSFGDLFKVSIGLTAQELGTVSPRLDGEFRVRAISPSDLGSGFITGDSPRYARLSDRVAGRLLRENDVVLNRAGSTFRVCVVDAVALRDAPAPMVATSNILVVHCSTPVEASYVACFLNGPAGLERLSIEGETVSHISSKALRKLAYPLPDAATMGAFATRYDAARRALADACRAESEARSALAAVCGSLAAGESAPPPGDDWVAEVPALGSGCPDDPSDPSALEL